jgi:HEAT repeat protein
MPAVLAALKAAQANSRLWATHAVVAMGPEAVGAMSTLESNLYDPDLQVRRASVVALGAIGPGAAGAKEALRKLAATEPFFQEIVKRSLRRIEGKQPTP